MNPLDRLNWLSEVNRAKLPPAALKVAVVLADMAFHNGECWPSYQTIADKSGIHKTTAKSATASLVSAGFLKVDRQAQGQRPDRKTNLFQLYGVVTRLPRDPLRGSDTATPRGSDTATQRGNIEDRKKSNKRKSAAKAFQEPSFEEWEAFCQKHGFEHIAHKSFEYYKAGEWQDRSGKPIRNWKQKLISVWFDAKKNPPPVPAAEDEALARQFDAALPDIERMEKEAQAIEKEKMQNVQRNRRTHYGD